MYVQADRLQAVSQSVGIKKQRFHAGNFKMYRAKNPHQGQGDAQVQVVMGQGIDQSKAAQPGSRDQEGKHRQQET